MSVMRKFVFTIAKNSFLAVRQSPLPVKKHNLFMGFVACRMVSTHHVSKNIEVTCQDDEASMALVKSGGPENAKNRPLVVILSWLFAKKSHIKKFADLYTAQGFDVVTVNVTPWQLMWPVNGTRVVAKDLLNFLHTHKNYQQIMLHGFSIAGYMWGEVTSYILEDPNKYNHVVDRIVGHVWDSAVDVTELVIGTSAAVFPHNEVMRKVLEKYIECHMKTFNKQATQYYIRSSQLFHTNIVHSPALFIMSETDPIGTIKSNMRVRDSWDSLGTPTYIKIFADSSHVGHYRKYPKEYENELFTFMNKLNVIKKEQIRARLQN